MESTYGDRSHGDDPDYAKHLAEIIERTFKRGGNVVIPTFAVGRMQEMLYFLREVKRGKMVKDFPDFEVYVDSPLAIEATGVYSRNVAEYCDDETRALIDKGINPIGFEGLKLSVTSEDSKAINYDPTPKVILSASGMCEAGRVRHHLKHNLWRPESTIVFVGYQVQGTLGRSLLDGAQRSSESARGDSVFAGHELPRRQRGAHGMGTQHFASTAKGIRNARRRRSSFGIRGLVVPRIRIARRGS